MGIRNWFRSLLGTSQEPPARKYAQPLDIDAYRRASAKEDSSATRRERLRAGFVDSYDSGSFQSILSATQSSSCDSTGSSSHSSSCNSCSGSSSSSSSSSSCSGSSSCSSSCSSCGGGGD